MSLFLHEKINVKHKLIRKKLSKIYHNLFIKKKKIKKSKCLTRSNNSKTIRAVISLFAFKTPRIVALLKKQRKFFFTKTKVKSKKVLKVFKKESIQFLQNQLKKPLKRGLIQFSRKKAIQLLKKESIQSVKKKFTALIRKDFKKFVKNKLTKSVKKGSENFFKKKAIKFFKKKSTQFLKKELVKFSKKKLIKLFKKKLRSLPKKELNGFIKKNFINFSQATLKNLSKKILVNFLKKRKKVIKTQLNFRKKCFSKRQRILLTRPIIYNFNLYDYFASFMIKEGKKHFIINKVNFVFSFLSKKLKSSRLKLLLLFFIRVQTSVEVRTIRVRRRLFVIPFLINIHRQIFLALKWFILALKEVKKKCSYEQKIIFEFLNLMTKKKSKTLSFFKKNNIVAYQNRANSHFRW